MRRSSLGLVPLAPGAVLVSAACWIGASLFTLSDSAVAGPSTDIPTRLSSTLWGPWSRIESRIELHGSVILYEPNTSRKAMRIKPTLQQWREFRSSIDELNVWEWPTSSHSDATDSGGWAIDIAYSDQAMRPVISAGDTNKDIAANDCSAAKVDSFTRFRAAVQRLLGDRPFGQRVSPLEFFPLSQLQLIMTHPSPRERDQWAEFRVPSGETYRMWRHLSDCCNASADRAVMAGTAYGTLREVTSTSVSLTELCRDAQGEWYERETIVTKVKSP